MLEAYSIAVNMTLTGGMAPQLGELAKQFEVIEGLATRIRARVKQMTADFGPLAAAGTAAAKAWEAAANAMDRAARSMGGLAGGPPMPGNYAPGAAPGVGGPRAMPPLLALPYMAPAGLLGAPSPGGGLVPLGSAPGGMGGAARGPLPIPVPVGGAVAAAGAASPFAMLSPMAKAYYAYQVGRHAFSADMREGAIEAGLLAQGFSREQVAEAYSTAVSGQQSIPGASLTGNLNIISKLMAVTQDPVASLKLMPEFARLGVVLDAQNKGHEGDALMAAIRAGEFRGVLTHHDEKTGKDTVDVERMVKFVRMMMATSIATKGNIGPAQMYQFLKSGGVTASMIDDESLFADSIALQLAMGSHKAGNALQALGTQFGSGRMSSGAMNLMTAMGLIKDPTKVQKVGIGQFLLLPGALDPAVANAATTNPAEFVLHHLVPKMREFLRTGVYQGGTAKNPKTIQIGSPDFDKLPHEEQEKALYRFATSLASRQTGANEIVEIMRNALLIERDRAALRGALGRDAFGIMANDNPAVRVKALGAAWEGLEVAFMKLSEAPILAAMQRVTDFLNTLSNVLNFGAVPRGMGPKQADVFPDAPGAGLYSALTGPDAFWRFSPFSRQFWLGGGGQQTTPLKVIVVNGRDIADGVTDNMGRRLNQPLGLGSTDPRMSPYVPAIP